MKRMRFLLKKMKSNYNWPRVIGKSTLKEIYNQPGFAGKLHGQSYTIETIVQVVDMQGLPLRVFRNLKLNNWHNWSDNTLLANSINFNII